jgi:hypothetical protein
LLLSDLELQADEADDMDTGIEGENTGHAGPELAAAEALGALMDMEVVEEPVRAGEGVVAAVEGEEEAVTAEVAAAAAMAAAEEEEEEEEEEEDGALLTEDESESSSDV